MEPEVLFEVEAVGRDLRMVRGQGPFFNQDTQEKSRIIQDEFFNTERESCVKENAFLHFC